MLDEVALVDLEGDAERASGLPQLTPVPVVAPEEVDQLVRSARAGVAMLSLQLRTALNDALLAESELPEPDLLGAEELVRSSLEGHVSARRRELAEELEHVRAEAAARVMAARDEAAELVGAATEKTRELLLRDLHQLSPNEPALRVVTDATPGAGAWSHPSVHWPAEPLGEGPPAAGPDTGSRDEHRDAIDVSVQAAVAHPAAAPSGAAVPGEITTRLDRDVVVDLDASASSSIDAVSSIATDAQQLSPPDSTPSGRGTLSRFLYVDVLLPMIAALVVLVILLAWVG